MAGLCSLRVGISRSFSNARWKRGFLERTVSPQGRLIESIDAPDDVRVRYYDGTESKINVDDFYLAFDSSCLSCLDSSNRLADLTVGRAGSPAGFETVLIRTEAGLRALEGAATKGEYLLDWSLVFGREDPEAFAETLLAAVEERVRSKGQLSRRIGRRDGRPLRFRPSGESSSRNPFPRPTSSASKAPGPVGPQARTRARGRRDAGSGTAGGMAD
ncbi:MAG: Coenzyme F420 hydrogenase/dehydrogenase, beta subunit C-terminal domain [Thermoplasmata archaeon]